jgi:ribonuclease HII
MLMKTRYVIGIDEAGRGPLAGPVAVGVVVVPYDFDWRLIPGVKDSKKLSEKKREAIYERATEMKTQGALRFAAGFASAHIIDTRGISSAIRSVIQRLLSGLSLDPADCIVLLDGSLRAPDIYVHQSTIIGGDDSEPVISLASICAKVSRDRLMTKLDNQYPQYGFIKHKGYGTAAHISALRTHGLSPEHRISFCKNIQTPNITVSK